jgi:hypothetical protein
MDVHRVLHQHPATPSRAAMIFSPRQLLASSPLLTQIIHAAVSRFTQAESSQFSAGSRTSKILTAAATHSAVHQRTRAKATHAHQPRSLCHRRRTLNPKSSIQKPRGSNSRIESRVRITRKCMRACCECKERDSAIYSHQQRSLCSHMHERTVARQAPHPKAAAQLAAKFVDRQRLNSALP